MSAKVAYASISEKGTTSGAAGNQTGKELKQTDYYDFGQNYYFRFYDSGAAWWMSDIMERLVKNQKIGYSQDDRTSLFTILKNNGWKSKNVKKKCNTDCSALVAAAFNCIDEKEILKSDTWTGNLKKRLDASGYGKCRAISSSYKPMAGDIIFKPGKHVVVCTYSTK